MGETGLSERGEARREEGRQQVTSVIKTREKRKKKKKT